MKQIISILFLVCFCQLSFGQKGEAPMYKLHRSDENYEYLKNKETNPYEEDFFDAIKFIPLNQNKDIYLSLGGEIRPRFEHYSNRFWESEEDENFYSQRLAFYTNLVFGKHFRVFTELYHGYTSHKEEFAEYDKLDFHQAFAEIIFPLKENQKLSFRFGRQEVSYGANRLIGLREGPNIRRSFDMAKASFKLYKTNIQAFYGKEVRPLFGTFDNEFTFFDSDAANPKLWGIYSQFQIKGFPGNNELYYLGFQSNQSTFNDVSGKETRHSIGLRRFGTLGKRFGYNTEIIYQFGEINSSDISAFNFETDWQYKLINTDWTPKVGLKLEYTSGDKNLGDGKINTFNPMFVNPAYYSLAATITPVNIISLHPSITLHSTEKLSIYTEYAFFWRASKNDGLYSPPRFLSRPANGISNKDLGSQFGLQLEYEINRHLTFDLDFSYFNADDFQKATGEAENIFHFASTISYKF